MSTAAENLALPPIADVMRDLVGELPLNDFGLPTGIYRSDLLPFHLYDSTPTQELPETVVEQDPPELLPLIPAAESAPAASAHAAPEGPPVDPFALLSGLGDGLPDMMNRPKDRDRNIVVKPIIPLGDYRIAGFPADELQKAFMPLQYDEGFPAFENGSSFWHRLPFEPQDAYQVFERYMMMSFGRMADREDEDDCGESAAGTRSLGMLLTQLHPTADDTKLLMLSDKFKEYYHLYYWGLRIRSYDLFRVTQHRQQQEIRAIETQDDHYLNSRRMRARLETYMDEDEDFWDMMTPKTAIDMHKHLTSLERISAGVPASGPQQKDSEGGKSFEMEFRTVAQSQRGDSGDGTLISEEGEILDQVLDDPLAVEVLQKLIIRTGGN